MRKFRNLTFILSLAAGPVFAQQQPWQTEAEIGSEEVVIVKERENELPPAVRSYQKVPPQKLSERKENIRYQFPEFSLQLKPVDPTVRVLTIKADPPVPYYNHYIKAGVGNYFSTYLDAWINSEKNPSSLYGLELKHRGAARGPVDKGNSGYSKNKIKGHAKFFGRNLTLDSEAYYQRSRFNFYGYDEEALDPEKSGLKQVFNQMGARLAIKNAENDRLGLGAGVAFYRTSSFLDARENLGMAEGTLRYELSDVLGVRLDSDLLVSNYKDSTSLSRNVFRVSPAFRFDYAPVEILAGFNIAYENDTAGNADQLHFYPRAEVRITPSESVEAWIGVEGNILPFTYQSLVNENPFVGEYLPLLHSNKTIDFYGNVKGRIGGGFGFGAGFSVANYKNMFFFVNSLEDSSRFEVIYDNGNTAIVNGYGELSYTVTDRFLTSLRADYFAYNTDDVAAAWHKPEYKVEWLANYNLYDKILFSANAFVLGGITAREIGTLDTEVELKPIADLGVGIEYLFSPQAAAFLQLENILSQQFERYYHYPSRGIVVTIGGSYAF
ncbi:hypothetical protein [Nafulsella turpanensis]|uniref:hypothetical protein n=1 Tax=Nafulsella turpanensis TaxID=1265690 RepID=UPI00034A822A|nr:hypothetical protein [Nafulsella turpanensis]